LAKAFVFVQCCPGALPIPIAEAVKRIVAASVATVFWRTAVSQPVNDLTALPALNEQHLHAPVAADFSAPASPHKPRILLLYGSLRKRSYSRLVIEESAGLLEAMGAEVRILNPEGLPQTDTEDASQSCWI